MSGRANRFPANFPIIIRKGPDMFGATICNISSDGGCVVGSNDMSKGDTAIVDYVIGQTRATVMWVTGNMMGLSFHSQISADGLSSIRAFKQSA